MKIANIRVPERRRAVNRKKLKQLANSIRQIGLLQPIIVKGDEPPQGTSADSGVLVAGLHRLEACKSLGWDSIETVDVHLQALTRYGLGDSLCSSLTVEQSDQIESELHSLTVLAEIDENLCRAELTASERVTATVRRKAIYEQLHPETKAGPSQAAGSNRAQGRDVAARNATTFVKDTAAKTGRSERAVRQDVQIGAGIAPVIEDIRGTAIEDRQTALAEVAKQPTIEAKRSKVTEEIEKARAPKPHKVTEPKTTEASVNDHLERFLASVQGAEAPSVRALLELVWQWRPSWDATLRERARRMANAIKGRSEKAEADRERFNMQADGHFCDVRIKLEHSWQLWKALGLPRESFPHLDIAERCDLTEVLA